MKSIIQKGRKFILGKEILKMLLCFILEVNCLGRVFVRQKHYPKVNFQSEAMRFAKNLNLHKLYLLLLIQDKITRRNRHHFQNMFLDI